MVISIEATERVDDEPDAEDGGESRRRSAGWPPHLASCGAPATRRHIAAERANITIRDSSKAYVSLQELSQGADASARRCPAGRGGAVEQTTYGRRALADAPPPPSASSSSTNPSKTADDFGSMRSRMACFGAFASSVDLRRLRCDEEAAKVGGSSVPRFQPTTRHGLSRASEAPRWFSRSEGCSRELCEAKRAWRWVRLAAPGPRGLKIKFST
jgi:hypothetical protein